MIGWRHEIEKLNREDALAFYKRFYTPNNAILVVAGDVTRRRGQGARRSDLRQGRRRRRDRPARAPAGAGADRAAHGDAGRSARRSSRACSAATSCRPPPPPSPAKPRRSTCWRTFSAAARPAGSTARWWSRREARGQRRRLVPGHGARCDALRRLRARRKPGVDAAAARSGDRRGDRRADRQAASPPRSSSAPRPG